MVEVREEAVAAPGEAVAAPGEAVAAPGEAVAAPGEAVAVRGEAVAVPAAGEAGERLGVDDVDCGDDGRERGEAEEGAPREVLTPGLREARKLRAVPVPPGG
jgi:hypothetical protein